MKLVAALAAPQCEWSWMLPSPPQCECTSLLCPRSTCSDRPQLPQPRQPPQCEWSPPHCPLPLLDLLRQTIAGSRRNQGSRRSASGAGCCTRRRSANAPACCPRSTCSDRPQPPQRECTCLLPLLDLLRQTGLDLLGQTAAAAAVRLLRQTVAPQPRQPPQCEWSAAVRMHLPAAFARPAQTDRRSATRAAAAVRSAKPPMAVAVARCGRIDRRMAALVSERAAVRTRPHLSQQAFRRHEQHEHEPPTIAGAVVGACTHGYTGSCSCVSRTSVARAASARTASCCCMSSTSLARGHIPRRSLKSTQSLGAAGAGCGWHHRRAGARVWLRGTRAGMHAKKGGRNKKMAAETWIRTPGWYIAQPGYTP